MVAAACLLVGGIRRCSLKRQKPLTANQEMQGSIPATVTMV